MTKGTGYGVVYMVKDSDYSDALTEHRLWYSAIFPLNQRNLCWSEKGDIVSFQLVKYNIVEEFLFEEKYEKIGPKWKTVEEYCSYFNVIVTLLQ